MLNDIQHSLTSNPLSFKGVNITATLELDPIKRPWNKAQAIFIGVMKEHANVPREAFDIRWVDKGLRVSVTLPPGRPALPALASFTIGANWALIFDRFGSLHRSGTPRSCSLETDKSVLTMVVQLFCARGRFTTFVVHGLTMIVAPPSWWAPRCCFLYTYRTVDAMGWTTSRHWRW